MPCVVGLQPLNLLTYLVPLQILNALYNPTADIWYRYNIAAIGFGRGRVAKTGGRAGVAVRIMVEVLETSGICGAGLSTGFKINVGTFVGW